MYEEKQLQLKDIIKRWAILYTYIATVIYTKRIIHRDWLSCVAPMTDSLSLSLSLLPSPSLSLDVAHHEEQVSGCHQTISSVVARATHHQHSGRGHTHLVCRIRLHHSLGNAAGLDHNENSQDTRVRYDAIMNSSSCIITSF